MTCDHSPKRAKKKKASLKPLPCIEDFVVVQKAKTGQDAAQPLPEPPDKVIEVVHAIRSSALKTGKKYKVTESFLKDAKALRKLDIRKEDERQKREEDRKRQASRDKQARREVVLPPPHFIPLAPNPYVEWLLQPQPGQTSQSSRQSPPPPPPPSLPPPPPRPSPEQNSPQDGVIPTVATVGTSHHSPPRSGTPRSQAVQNSEAVPIPAPSSGASDSLSLSPTAQGPLPSRRVRFDRR